MKIGILGEKKSILAFRALGVDVFGVESKEDLSKAKEEIEKEEFAIIFITEDIAKDYPEEIELFYQETLPATLVIPGVKGSLGLGREGLKKIVERALGSDILETS